MAKHKAKRREGNGPPARPDKGFLQVQGTIEELLPSARFRVKLDSGHEILAYLAGRMRLHKIRILPGDRVTIEMTPYDLSKGRIVYRL